MDFNIAFAFALMCGKCRRITSTQQRAPLCLDFNQAYHPGTVHDRDVITAFMLLEASFMLSSSDFGVFQRRRVHLF